MRHRLLVGIPATPPRLKHQTAGRSVLGLCLFWIVACSGGHHESAPSLPKIPKLAVEFLPAYSRPQIDQAYRLALQRQDDPSANASLAKVLHVYELLSAAEACYRRAAALDPNSFDTRYYLAWAQSARGNADDALRTMTEALRLKPDYLPGRLKHAGLVLEKGRTSEALGLYREIVKDHPAHPVVQFGLGRTLAAGGDWQGARTAFEEACHLFPSYAAAHYAAAEASRHAGDATKASEHAALFEASRGDEPKVLDPLMETLQELDRSPRALFDRSKAAMERGDWNGAARWLEEVLQSDAHNPGAHINLITVYGRTGDRARAERHYRMALTLSPGSADLYNGRGVLLLSTDRRQARGEFERALKLDPRHVAALENLAGLAVEAGQTGEAIRYYRRAVEIEPHQFRAWIQLGRLHLKQRDIANAREAFLRIIHPKVPGDGALRQVAAAYRATGNWNDWVDFAKHASVRASRMGMTSIRERIDGSLQ